IEFLAEHELITIIPSSRIGELRFLEGTYGPFAPPERADVPLWLAVTLRGKGKCRVVPPAWLTVEALQTRCDEERAHAQFSALPFHHAAIARLLLSPPCADDIPNAASLRILVRDLRDLRQSKILGGVGLLDGEYLQMDGLGWMEVNEMRPFFVKAFGTIRQLAATAVAAKAEDDDVADHGAA
ncbi:DNA replication complex GINS protein PSF2, partial [Caulochytrium protostelioides]